MEPSHRDTATTASCPHRHRHCHHRHCHCHCHHHYHCHISPIFVPHVPWTRASGSVDSVPEPAFDSGALVYEEHERKEWEEEDDEEPIFVLTDEWKEFFAKSEAKRKLEKKQAKKNKRT